MNKYNVVVEILRQTTYEIEAETPKEAEEKYWATKEKDLKKFHRGYTTPEVTHVILID